MNNSISENSILEEARRDALDILKRYREINPSGISDQELDKSVFRRQIWGDLKAEVPVFDLYMTVFPEYELPKYNIWRPGDSRINVAEEIAKIVWLQKGKKVATKIFEKYTKYFVLFLLFPNGSELERKILEYYEFASKMGNLHELTFDKIVRWIASSYWISEDMAVWAYKLKLFSIPEVDASLVEKSKRISEGQLKMIYDAESKLHTSAVNNRMKQVASLNSENTNRPVG